MLTAVCMGWRIRAVMSCNVSMGLSRRGRKHSCADNLVLDLVQATGNFAGTIAGARADGVITPNEAKDTGNAGVAVQKIAVDLVAAIQNKVRVG